jgi:hypothetical protein
VELRHRLDGRCARVSLPVRYRPWRREPLPPRGPLLGDPAASGDAVIAARLVCTRAAMSLQASLKTSSETIVKTFCL